MGRVGQGGIYPGLGEYLLLAYMGRLQRLSYFEGSRFFGLLRRETRLSSLRRLHVRFSCFLGSLSFTPILKPSPPPTFAPLRS